MDKTFGIITYCISDVLHFAILQMGAVSHVGLM